ncbi:unnamed protein product [Bursaphelenchus okinawaensis]|uniref:Uncharacterized protein n=1 Tax=Bursaphelenchus okinawaensis TaxID=465554 RepID=A0A811KRL1_9BILA|nr:unnamed protein product [Bursaphelenchus okinawaensis]CAG9110359.1 unnamed protein product [Bursaphelenchus okinawaensis]
MFKVSKSYSRKHERKRDDNFVLPGYNAPPPINRSEQIEYSSVRNGRSPGPYGRDGYKQEIEGERSYQAERSFSGAEQRGFASGEHRGLSGAEQRAFSEQRNADRSFTNDRAGFAGERAGYAAERSFSTDRAGFAGERAAGERYGTDRSYGLRRTASSDRYHQDRAYSAQNAINDRGYTENERAWHSSASHARSPPPNANSPRSERGVYQAGNYWVSSPPPSRLSSRNHDTAYSAYHYNERQQREAKRQELRELARERYFKTKQPFHEKTEWETKEHYERKVKRVKKPQEQIKYVVREVKASEENKGYDGPPTPRAATPTGPKWDINEHGNTKRSTNEHHHETPLNVPQQNQEVVHDENLDHFENLEDLPEQVPIQEVEDEMQRFDEDIHTKTEFYEMEGKLNQKTDELLTFVEALREGLLNLSSGTGEFYDLVSGARISLERAAELGYIKNDLNEVLNGRHGIRHPETQQELTLLEAIRIGLFDPEKRQFRDLQTGEILWSYDPICNSETQRRLIKAGVLKVPPLSVENAVRTNAIDPRTGVFKGQYAKEPMPLREALQNGYLQFGSASPRLVAPSLTDVIRERLIDPVQGKFIDKHTNEEISFREACRRGTDTLLNQNVREVVNTKANKRLALADAIYEKAINQNDGTFNDLKAGSPLSLRDAYERGFIGKPLTLTEAVDKGHIDAMGRVTEPGTGHHYTLIEALAHGVIDPDAGHIRDKNSGEVISVVEALERGFLLPEGQFSVDGRNVDIRHAKHEGLLVGRHRYSIFDVQGIKKQGRSLTFNEAVAEGLLDARAEKLDGINFAGAADFGVIDRNLQRTLTQPIGLKDGHREVNLVQAVGAGLIDPKRGVLLYHGRESSPRELYDAGALSLKGAIKLTGLLDIHPALITGARKIEEQKRRIGKPAKETKVEDDHVKLTIQDAMKQGLLDTRNQRFRNGKEEISLDDALNQGLVHLNDEWIVPKSQVSQGGPTLEEKIKETLTHTQQELAPQIFPDKQLEENVETKRRVRRTEAKAEGGPGSATYRAITGGKDGTQPLSFRTVGQPHVEESEHSWVFDSHTGRLTDAATGELLTLDAAVRSGRLPKDELRVRDALSGREMGFTEAEQWGIVSAKDGFYLDKTNNRRVSLAEAAQQHRVYPTGGVPEHAGDSVVTKVRVQKKEETATKEAINARPEIDGDYNLTRFLANGLYDQGNFLHPETEKELTLKELILHGFLSPYQTKVVDKATGEQINLMEAIDRKIVDENAGTVKDTKTGRNFAIDEALRNGLIKEEESRGAIEGKGGRFDMNTGVFHPRPKSALSRHSTHSVGQQHQQVVEIGGRNVPVNVVKGADGVERGEYVDPKSGMKFTIQSSSHTSKH